MGYHYFKADPNQDQMASHGRSDFGVSSIPFIYSTSEQLEGRGCVPPLGPASQAVAWVACPLTFSLPSRSLQKIGQ